jgi:DNA-binding XRE family transcriptional regulator
LRGHKPAPPGYPESLETVGDHIRKKRMDFRLTQKEVAEGLGVNKDTIRFWENSKARPSLVNIPKIIEFLEYDPFEHKLKI